MNVSRVKSQPPDRFQQEIHRLWKRGIQQDQTIAGINQV
jgi:hypothetical protein